MEETQDIIKQLEAEGYEHLKTIPGRGICGIMRMVFTTGLFYGMDEDGVSGRWCYQTKADARSALEEWDGVGDPPGDWIKYKGKGGERSNKIIL